jgi:hypothetical protein
MNKWLLSCGLGLLVLASAVSVRTASGARGAAPGVIQLPPHPASVIQLPPHP